MGVLQWVVRVSLLWCVFGAAPCRGRQQPNANATHNSTQTRKLSQQHNPINHPQPTPQQGFRNLDTRMKSHEAVLPRANRVFFLSIPPNVFLDAAGNAADIASSR